MTKKRSVLLMLLTSNYFLSMKTLIKRTLFLVVSALILSSVPASAQWVKAGKAAAKVAEKAMSKNGSKVVKSVTKPAAKTTTTTTNTNTYRYYRNASPSAAYAPRYVKVTCSVCKGNGFYYYNGYKYKCATCNGQGYKWVYR